MYDVIIIGAGLAGLRVGLGILKKKRSARVAILEKYHYIGGRVVTHYKDGYQWEIGAGRISESHSKIRDLMTHYGLTWIPIAGDDNEFYTLKNAYLQPLLRLSNDILEKYTLFEIVSKIHGEQEAHAFFSLFPYWAEVYRLRADLALDSFRHEMKSNKGFGMCKEGLSAIIRSMAKEFRQRGGRIILNSEVVDIRRANGLETIYVVGGDQYQCKTCVMALHRDAVAKIKSVAHWNGIRHLTMDPLVRMYAVFPSCKDVGTWFSGLTKAVTPGRLRYVIPINPRKGIIMISYTDGADAKYWIHMLNAKGKEKVQMEVMKDIRELFSDRKIPDPLQFHIYPWTSGCTYWTPGHYDPLVESKEALCVRDGLFCCGESWSMKQAWMEGALDHADMLLQNKDFKEIYM